MTRTWHLTITVQLQSCYRKLLLILFSISTVNTPITLSPHKQKQKKVADKHSFIYVYV